MVDYGYIVVAAAFYILVVSHGTRYSFGVFVKPMLNDFGWTRAMISATFSLSWIVEGIMAVFLGRLNDKIGPRIVTSICGFISGVAYLLMSQISDITHLFLIYGVMLGIGSTVFTPLVSTTARWFTKRRTVMTGIVTAGVGIGSLFLPPIIERLIAVSGWRMSSIIIGIILLIVVIVAAQFLKSEPSESGHGDTYRDNESLKAIDESFSLKETIVTRQFWAIFTMFFCFGFSLLTIQVHMVPYLTDLGISSAIAASILATVGGASVVGRIALGTVGDRIGNRRTFGIGLFIMLLALVWFTFTREIWGAYLFAAVLGVGYGGCTAQMSPLIAKLFGLTSLGVIFGIATTGFTIGAAIGPFVSGYIFDTTGEYQLAFLACIVIMLIGILLNMLIKPTRIKVIGRL